MPAKLLGAPGGATGATPAVVLSTTNLAGTALTFLRTNDQIAIFDATVPVTQASADAAAAGTAAVAARRDHRHGMPTLAAAVITREGGQLTEATTTSTTSVDLLTASTLTIAVGEPFYAVAAVRKTTGAVASARAGVKLNTTIVLAAQPWASSANEANQGLVQTYMSARVTGYFGSGVQYLRESVTANTGRIDGFFSADAPNAQLTDYILTAFVADALVTMGADELNVYSLVNA